MEGNGSWDERTPEDTKAHWSGDEDRQWAAEEALFCGINKILRRVTGKENNSYIILVSAVKLDVQISGCHISISNDKT